MENMHVMLDALLADQHEAVLATIVQVEGSAYRKAEALNGCGNIKIGTGSIVLSEGRTALADELSKLGGTVSSSSGPKTNENPGIIKSLHIGTYPLCVSNLGLLHCLRKKGISQCEGLFLCSIYFG